MAAVPLVKLVYLGIRQLSKPVASVLKVLMSVSSCSYAQRAAVDNTLLRTYIVQPIGQGAAIVT